MLYTFRDCSVFFGGSVTKLSKYGVQWPTKMGCGCAGRCAYYDHCRFFCMGSDRYFPNATTITVKVISANGHNTSINDIRRDSQAASESQRKSEAALAIFKPTLRIS